MPTALEEISRSPAPDGRAVRAHLDTVLASPQFSSSPRLARFLEFVVETTLAGRASEIKEALIAVEVYGRPATYDPQSDSTVRVEAWRLRAKLREFYQSAPAGPWTIELPKGRYVPVFRANHPPEPDVALPAPPVRRRSSASLFFALGLCAAVALGLTVLPRPATTTEAPPPEVLKLYSRGWELLRHSKSEDGAILPVRESVQKAIRLFQEVVRRSPNYARGWVSLAEAGEFAWELDPSRPAQLLDMARSAAQRAIDLEPRLPDGHTVLCSIRFFRDWDLPRAQTACERAVELNPRDVIAQRRLADLRRVLGRHADARRALDAAISLAPADPGLRLRKARVFYDLRQYERAAEETRASLALNGSRQMPTWTLSLWLQGLCHERLGLPSDAEASYRQALAHDADDMWAESALASLLARTGRVAEAEQMLRIIRQRAGRGEDRAFAIALVQFSLDRPDEALDWLERGFDRREDSMLYLGLEQRFERLHGNPRFQSLLGRLETPGAVASL